MNAPIDLRHTQRRQAFDANAVPAHHYVPAFVPPRTSAGKKVSYGIAGVMSLALVGYGAYHYGTKSQPADTTPAAVAEAESAKQPDSVKAGERLWSNKRPSETDAQHEARIREVVKAAHDYRASKPDESFTVEQRRDMERQFDEQYKPGQ